MGGECHDVAESARNMGYTPFFVISGVTAEVEDDDYRYKDDIVGGLQYVESEDLVVLYRLKDWYE